MPIDARIPLGVTGLDPNGFVNALGAGMKMRELRNAADRLAAKEDAAATKSNALSKFYQSPRGSEDIATLAREAPDAVSGIEKNTREAQLAQVQTQKYKVDNAKADIALMRESSQALAQNPTDENFEAIMASVAPQLSDPAMPKLWRTQWYSAKTPEARQGYANAWAMSAEKAQRMVMDQAKLDAPPDPKWDSYNNRFVAVPTAGGAPTMPTTGSPAGPEPVRPGTVVPGGELPPPEDIDAAVLHRAGQGPAPTGNVDYEGLSDEGLDELQRTSTFQKGQKPGAPPPGPSTSSTPVDGQPTPVQPTPPDGPQAPVAGQPPPVYQSQAHRDAARDAVKDARYKEERAQKAPKTITKGGVTYQYADGQWIPAQGVVTTPADPPRAVSQADAKWLKDQDESGAAAEKLSSTIQQARSVIAAPAGVLGNSPMDQAAYKLHEWGVNNSETAVNTERLRELGAQMTLSFGSLGAQVSNADREVYARAQGNFENAKSPEAMKLSLDQMSAVSENVIAKINQNRTTYQQTGRKPDFAPAVPVQATPQTDRPSPTPVKVAPLEDLDSMPMPGKYSGKFLTTPEGIRYRSDGTRWVRQ